MLTQTRTISVIRLTTEWIEMAATDPNHKAQMVQQQAHHLLVVPVQHLASTILLTVEQLQTALQIGTSLKIQQDRLEVEKAEMLRSFQGMICMIACIMVTLLFEEIEARTI
jgi:hypothetical protein